MQNTNKKILPLNKEPMLMCFGEHASWLSILTGDFNNDNTLAIISDLSWNIDGKDTNDFALEANNVSYEKIEKDLILKADPYHKDMYFNPYHIASGNCSIKVHLKWQMLTITWANFSVYLSNKQDTYKMDRDNDFSIFRIYRDLKTGFHKLTNGTMTDLAVDNRKDDFWLMLEIKDHTVYSYVSYDNVEWIAVAENDFDATNTYVIGMNINFYENQFYNWFYMNYIQIRCWNNLNDTRQVPMNFYVPLEKNFRCNVYHPLLGYINMNTGLFADLGISIVDYIKANIDHNKYVDMWVNEFYIPERPAYKKHYFEHINMVYGYDDEKKVFYICGYTDMYFAYTEVDYNSFALAFNSCNRIDFINSTYMDMPFYNYELKIHEIILQLEDYINSYDANKRFEQFNEITDGCYGISIYKTILKNEENLSKFIQDKRLSHLIYEHKKVMLHRIEFLYKRGYLKDSEYKELYPCFEKILTISLITRNIVLKNIINVTEKSRHSVVLNIHDLYKLESEYISKLISALKKNASEVKE